VDDKDVALVKRGDLQSSMMSLDQIHRLLQPCFCAAAGGPLAVQCSVPALNSAISVGALAAVESPVGCA
jgi:hypothetical protein